MLAGVVSAWGTTVSVSNIAGWTGVVLDLGTAIATDIVFGTAANSIAAATYRASIDTSKNNKAQPQTSIQNPNSSARSKLYCDWRLR